MTRPIFWALGVTACAAVWGVGLAERFDRPRSQPAPITAAALQVQAASAPETSSNALILHADAKGQFSTQATVDGLPLRMLVDTGATHCAFSEEDAERVGIRVYERDFTHKIQTANGIVAAAYVRIPMIRVGAISVRDVEAIVVPRGRLSTSLLGMSFLRRLSDVNMNQGRLTLRG
jgi:aspartyl protease family protein